VTITEWHEDIQSTLSSLAAFFGCFYHWVLLVNRVVCGVYYGLSDCSPLRELCYEAPIQTVALPKILLCWRVQITCDRNRKGFLTHEQKYRRAYCGAPALLASNLRPRRITLGQSRTGDLPWKQNGVVDRLRYLTAQAFASDVVGSKMLPGVYPTQSRLLRRR